jgi:hemolysin activation/secretion protein
LREQQPPVLELPKPAPAIKVDRPAQPALQPSAVTRFILRSLRISGNTVFGEPELLAVVQDQIGKEVGYPDLETAAARISRYYRERGYLVARAYLPAQEIKDGGVEIAVIEGRFGKINLHNDSRVREDVVGRYTSGLPGSVVSERNLERKLLLLNDLAGVGEARANLSPGARVGESDLTVAVTAAPLISGSVDLDNHGNRFIGTNRLTGRLNLHSPLGLGDALSGLFAKGFTGLEYGRLTYQVPLGGDGLTVGAAYSDVHYRLGKSFSSLDASGESHAYTLNLSYPFIRARNFSLYGQLAQDWRDFEDRLGSTATVTDKSTRATTLTLNGDASNTLLGAGVSVFALAYNSGTVRIETTAALAIDSATARISGRFDKWNLNLLHVQALDERLSVYFSLSLQQASKNLDSSEKFILGGANGVRAYPQGEAPGDSGYLATAELRYALQVPSIPGVLQPFMFVDAGGVTINENPFTAADNKRSLAGTGIGLSWTKAGDFQLKLTLATRIGKQPSVSSDTDRHTVGWVQAIRFF